MKQSKKTKNQLPIDQSSGSPGVVLHKDGSGLSFDSQDLPASEHFFRANCFSAIVEGGELVVLFGQRSSFFKGKVLNAAAEVSFPIKLAVEFLYKAIWVTPSLSGETTFIDIIEKNIEMSKFYQESDTARGILKENDFELPESMSTYRAFSANNATTSLAQGQGMVEFFEASPNLIANLTHGRKMRKSDGLKNVIAIILPPDVMRNFFHEIKNLLGPFVNNV